MKKKSIIFICVLSLSLILGINIYLVKYSSASGKISVKLTQLKEETLRSTIMIPGTLTFADEQYVYYNAENGDVDKIHVTEGSKLQTGQPIVTYESAELELEKEQNKLEKKSSQLQIDSLYNKLNNLNKKQKELEKMTVNEEEKDQIELERTQLNLDLETAKIGIEQNQLQANLIKKKEEGLEVRSGINGTVLKVNKEAVNNSSEVQTPLVHIGNTDEYIVTGVLSEYDALNIKSGQPVTITSDVLPNKKWKGEVKQIDLLPQQKPVATDGASDGANQYPVVIKVIDEDIKSIKPGFKLLLEIETSSKKAKSIPLKAIINEDKKMYVFVVKDGKVVRNDIKVGQTTNEFIEVVNGLSDKDKVVTNPSDQLTDGTEVNVQ